MSVASKEFKRTIDGAFEAVGWPLFVFLPPFGIILLLVAAWAALTAII